MKSSLLSSGMLGLCLWITPVLRGEVKTWTHDTGSDFEEGTLENVVVSSQGTAELARQTSAFVNLDVAHVWSMVREEDGSVLVGTGSPGRVVRVKPTGEIQSLHEARDQQMFAVTVGPDGSIYYAASPGGEVFRYSRDGQVSTLFETEETYIWGLAIDSAGRLLIATGPQGRLYRVDATGKGEIFFQAKQKHLLSMALAKDGSIFLGTSTDGLIYRVDPAGKGFVLYDAAQADVHTLLLHEDGTLFAGTGTPERPNFPSPSASRWSPRGVAWAAAWSLVLAPPLVPVAEAPAPAPAPKPVARPGLAGVGENSVYRIAASGHCDEIFRDKCLVLSLGWQEGKLLVGTGQEGKLYAIDPLTRVRQTLARLDSGQIQAMISLPAGNVVLGTGTPGNLWRVEARYSPRGTIESSPHDAKMQARWGQGSTSAEVPTGARLLVEFRAGNVEKPDETWSLWSSDARSLPISRFLQYRATLESGQGNESPQLRNLSVYYATVNRPPIVDSIDVPNFAQTPVADGSTKIEIKWKGSDPNGDTLLYDVDVRKEEWPEWVAVAREMNETSFKWDPGSYPSGQYRFRVTASDAPSNRQSDQATSSKESEPFVLDRQAPAVTISSATQVGQKLDVSTVAKDDRTRLVSASYSLNGIDWWPLFPDDGIFDSSEEAIRFQTGELQPHTYLLLVRFRDSAGHWGVADQVIRVEAPAKGNAPDG
ncbi:hypothetical protein K2X85_02380 [bacterium]|jgi:hypothetical protein|nr:hypothetical protein [bacterium]